MGLDMYLRGEEWLGYREQPETRNGFKIEAVTLELGYWRKHPDLHGYIVQTFAGGVDECQRIPLSVSDLVKTREAVKSDVLPHTTGFFFGESTPEDKEPTLKILDAAIAWASRRGGWREIYYQASW